MGTSSRRLSIMLLLAGLVLSPLAAFAAPPQYQIVAVTSANEVAATVDGKAPVSTNLDCDSPRRARPGLRERDRAQRDFGYRHSPGRHQRGLPGHVFPSADVDWYSLTAAAGDRVYAAVMTSFSANASADSQLRLFQPDGTTLIEFDENDGSFGTTS